MAIKTFNPVTKSLRGTALLRYDDITRSTPEKSLTTGKMEKAGRSNGRISVRRKGGGHKKLLRLVDFHREKFGVPAVVKEIEYDPNRSSHLALLSYKDGVKRYILAPRGVKVGDALMSGPQAPIRDGNALPLENIPVGRNIHGIELQLGKGAQLARSAGTSAQLAGFDGDYAIVKLPSGEMRMVFKKCIATIGEVGNEDHMNVKIGKAGRNRWLGKRPSVRGVAMNPVDHPLGGGQGKTSGGRHPVTPWGQPTRGYKTRQKNKSSDRFIIKRRK
ncbi:MAG: 50S ribosomal protein L2 [Spirochaetales bacterium]|nr:50S ribosomal protein L2 [Spirochaetales bacterium]